MSPDVEKVYIIDTSVLIDIRRHYPIPDLWHKIKELFEANRLFSHEYVYEELVPDSGDIDDFTRLVIEFKEKFLSTSQRQMDIVAEIIHRFPQLIDLNSKKNQADPYIVAIAKEMTEAQQSLFSNKEYVVVTNESKTKPMRIPAVCREYEIRQIDIFEFFEENGWRLEIQS